RFYFHDTAPTEIYTRKIVGSVICVLETDFQGAVLFITHDRAFLDNVVTRKLVLEGVGKVRVDGGGDQDGLRQGASPRLLGV
ncbi:hypothetical protein, partial [Pseudomonas syringae group genomosp. 7]